MSRVPPIDKGVRLIEPFKVQQWMETCRFCNLSDLRGENLLFDGWY